MVLGLGSSELLLISLAVLVFFGPEKIPEFSRKLGHYSAKLRGQVQELRDTIEAESKPEVEYPEPSETGLEIPEGHD